jgi:hypothetical protein
MRGDINASELFNDREFLLRVGLGLMDVPFGSGGTVGFEDVKQFAYVDDQQQDPKHYRRKVAELTGHYYPNDMARVLWNKFHEEQACRKQETGIEPCLQEAARYWLARNGHTFFKEWTLQTEEVPFRMRNLSEPRLGLVDLAAIKLAPEWRELIVAGFRLPRLVFAGMRETVRGRHERYLRIVARVSGLPITNDAELAKRCREIQHLRSWLSRHVEQEVSLKAATVEYYRRLRLVAELEGKNTADSNSAALAY